MRAFRDDFHRRPAPRSLAPLLCSLLLAGLAGCGNDGGDDDARRAGASVDPASALPAPEGAVGSVTGMPARPAPGTVPLARTGSATGTTGIAAGDAGAASADAGDDGGLHAMAVDTDYPEVVQPGAVAPDASAVPPPPVIIVPPAPPTPQPPPAPAPAPAPAADGTASTTFVTDATPDDDDAD